MYPHICVMVFPLVRVVVPLEVNTAKNYHDYIMMQELFWNYFSDV